MRRLTIISNMTKIPCTKLLHLAVGVFFDETRSLMTHLLRSHEESGRPLESSLSNDFDIRHYLPAKPSNARHRPTSARHPQAPIEDRETRIPLYRNDTTRAAESLVTPGQVAEPRESSSGTSQSSTGQQAGATSEQLDQVLVELQAQRDEIRVVWQAIDELREWSDHALRNPPETQSPPLRIWSLASDPMAEDFGQRINAIPPEQMDALRQSLTAPACDEPAPKPPSQQRDLF